MVIGSQTRFFRLPTYEFSPYLYSFMFAMIYRYSCYKCPFAKVTRQGDITLADFWGIHHFFSEYGCTTWCVPCSFKY